MLDPLTLLGVQLLVGAAALLAAYLPTYLPTYLASRAHPVAALGHDAVRLPYMENEGAVGYRVPETGDPAARSASGRNDDQRAMPSVPGSSRSSGGSGLGSPGTARTAPPALASSATGLVKVTCPPVLSDHLDLPRASVARCDRRRRRSRGFARTAGPSRPSASSQSDSAGSERRVRLRHVVLEVLSPMRYLIS